MLLHVAGHMVTVLTACEEPMMMNSAERATAAIFPDRESAHASLQALEQAGFGRPWMAVTRPVASELEDEPGVRSADAASATTGLANDHGSEHDVAESSDGVFGAIGRFFSGEGNSLRRSLEDHGIDPDDAEQIDGMIAASGAVVVVNDERAAAILARSGGRLVGAGTGSGAYATAPKTGAYDAATDATTGFTDYDERSPSLGDPSPTGSAAEDDLRTVQLREERLRIDKERISAGEATVGKRVVSERASVDVPVTHEELFVERRPVAGTRAATGTIGDGETIHVPLSREELRVEKTPVVREEVAVGQRRVEDVRHVDETLQREELDVNAATADPRGTVDDPARAPRRDVPRANPSATDDF